MSKLTNNRIYKFLSGKTEKESGLVVVDKAFGLYIDMGIHLYDAIEIVEDKWENEYRPGKNRVPWIIATIFWLVTTVLPYFGIL